VPLQGFGIERPGQGPVIERAVVPSTGRVLTAGLLSRSLVAAEAAAELPGNGVRLKDRVKSLEKALVGAPRSLLRRGQGVPPDLEGRASAQPAFELEVHQRYEVKT
jgi:hypothetical protein